MGFISSIEHVLPKHLVTFIGSNDYNVINTLAQCNVSGAIDKVQILQSRRREKAEDQSNTEARL